LKVSSSKLEKHQKCMRCDEIPCINFYRWTKGKPAGEITTYKRMIKALDWRPCEAGSLIYYFCQVFQPFQDDFLSGSLLYQCIRDLKSCVFLLWFGHYRSSLQILRPIVENFLAALYFDVKFNQVSGETEREKVREDYIRFCKNDYEVTGSEWLEIFPKEEWRRKLDQKFLLKWLVAKGRIDGKRMTRIQKLVGRLNIYLHPHVEYPETSECPSPDCPSLVGWDNSEYEKCITILQDVVAELLWLFRYHVETSYSRVLRYKRTRATLENAKEMLKALEDLEHDLGRRLIFSERLRSFINEL